MTPRSKKYFAKKRIVKGMHRLFDIVDWMVKVSQPIPRYPEGTYLSGAIVGEVGPELVTGPDGSIFMPTSRLVQIEKPINDILLANEYRDRLRRSSCSNIKRITSPVECMSEEQAKILRERLKQ